MGPCSPLRLAHQAWALLFFLMKLSRHKLLLLAEDLCSGRRAVMDSDRNQ